LVSERKCITTYVSKYAWLCVLVSECEGHTCVASRLEKRNWDKKEGGCVVVVVGCGCGGWWW